MLISMSLFAGEQKKAEVKVTAQIVGNKIVASYQIPEGMHITLQKDYLYVDADSVDWLKLEPTIYPKGVKDADGDIVYHGQMKLTRQFTFLKKYTDSRPLKIFAGFQACLDSGTCMFPDEKEFTLNIKYDKKYDINNVPAENEKPLPAKKAPISAVLKYLLMAFLGGIILNVMPCVLPVLSIKAMSLVKQSHQDKKEILKGSLMYTAGIIVSFIVMASVVIFLKISGEMVGWGFQFQSSGFVMALLIMIFVFALSMFDVLIFNAPGMNKATQASQKQGHWGSFLSGIFAVLLATPCTAPMLGAALGFAFTQPPLMILAIFILIGLGLALPFLLIGFWPAAIKIIPRPGDWMNVFKEIMGFLLFATALFLLRTLYFLVGGDGTFNILWFLIVLSFSTWMFGRWTRPHIPHKKQWVMAILAVLISVFAGMFLLRFNDSSSNKTEMVSSTKGNWGVFSPEKVQELRDAGKPVFIDFGAEWCMTCKTNEKVVLYTDEIQKAFRDHNVVLLRGDNTKRDPIINEWLRKFKRAGVPLYIMYIPGKDEPEVLPELITKDMVLNMLKKLDK